jgi:hypothetical protein
MQQVRIRCPKCDWEPDGKPRWACSVCKTRWNTFETKGQCPACGKIYTETSCSSTGGGCGESSPHSEWYEYYNEPVKSENEGASIWFWKNKNQSPITETDKQWIEGELIWLTEVIDPIYFKILSTITPDNEELKMHFSGTEEDAHFILEKLTSIMNIDAWEIQLMFYSEKPTRFSEGITATPAEGLKHRWNSPLGKYVDKGFGNKEIWIELEQINDPVGLIATLASELAVLKLTNEYGLEEQDKLLADLTAVVFGLGIFMGNAYFKFAQWHGNTHHGWRMQKRGGLPEMLIAYSMAWLAHYRNEDVSWKRYLNKTMKKYFEKCYTYIEKNKDKIAWS